MPVASNGYAGEGIGLFRGNIGIFEGSIRYFGGNIGVVREDIRRVAGNNGFVGESSERFEDLFQPAKVLTFIIFIFSHLCRWMRIALKSERRQPACARACVRSRDAEYGIWL